MTEIAHEGGHQQHPLSIYIGIWILLFVLSGFSYAVDYFSFQGYLRWGLILLFMFLKAGFIVAIFMHLAWERLALILAILMPAHADENGELREICVHQLCMVVRYDSFEATSGLTALF